jgi:DNA-binding MarR family transcriptional regulator
MRQQRSRASDPGDHAGDSLAEHVRWATSTWPQIDPDVEGIVSRVDKVHRYLQSAFRASIGQAGLTKDEWNVLMALRRHVRSHGWLCRELAVSTGAMTYRLDGLEQRGLVKRAPDPNDRRGVLLEITPAGHARLDEYVYTGASRERELLEDLTQAERQQLNRLLSKWLAAMERSSPTAR